MKSKNIKQMSVKESMELMEMIVGDFRIYSHEPEGDKGKKNFYWRTLLVISDKFKIKYYGIQKIFLR